MKINKNILRSNYHTHCDFCDGEGPPEDYVLAALEKHFDCLGFSCHAPLPYDISLMEAERLEEYIGEVRALRKKYKNEINVFLGLEIDYIPNVSGPRSEQYKCLDFTIGAVHFVDFFEDGSPFGIDRTNEMFLKGLNEIFSGDIRKLCGRYYQLIREMLRLSPPDILAHLDKIKRHNKLNRLFSETETWYKDEITATLEAVKKANVTLEVNTSGLRGEGDPYLCPGEWILQLIKEYDIPIILSSDAHHPSQVQTCFESVLAALKAIGFKV